MKTPQKHADLIKAWADGAEIEEQHLKKDWQPFNDGHWMQTDSWNYRIKPKPDVVDYVFVGAFHRISACQLEWARETNSNLKLTWDFETGKLKTAEVIA